jgi:hypothetical protein
LELTQYHVGDRRKGKFLPYFHTHHADGRLGVRNDPLTKYFLPFLKEESVIKNSILSDLKKTDCEPFFWILRSCIEHNSIVGEELRPYYKSLKLNEGRSRSDFVSTPTIALSISAIRMSRIIANDSLNIVRPIGEVDSPLPSMDSKIEAQLSAHSERTRRVHYLDKSLSKEKITSNSNFVVRMGELMIEDAVKMGELSKKTSVVNYKEALKLLGCYVESETPKEMLKEWISGLEIDSKVELRIGLMDEIIVDGRTIFVATKITAALIYLRINHLYSQINDLIMDDPDNKNKAIIAANELAYCKYIISQFPEDIKAEGKIYSDDLSLSYASLL